MGRTPSCGKLGLKRGPWTPEEDLCLTNYVKDHGEGRWGSLSKKAGLLRSGKSCRMRWLNYLQPDVKRGRILPDEEDLILRLHRLLGNRWSLIAGRLPGRTDNDVKNHWNIRLSKKLISQGIDPRTHKPLSESEDIWWNPEESNMEQNILLTSATLESCNQEIHEKHSDFIIADHKEDSSVPATQAISGFPSGPVVFSSASEIDGYSEVSNYNCCEMPKQETYSSRFPFSLPATPTAFLTEDFQLGEDNSASNPKYELWSRLLSPNCVYIHVVH